MVETQGFLVKLRRFLTAADRFLAHFSAVFFEFLKFLYRNLLRFYTILLATVKLIHKTLQLPRAGFTGVDIR
jgi:hypothetical protein